MRVREHTADDDLVPLLLRVHARDGYPLHATPGQATAFLASGRRVAAWVAEQDGRLVGHVALHHDPAHPTLAVAAERTGLRVEALALVARLFVDPDSQRDGVGRTLLRHAVEQAQSRGLRAVLDVGQTLHAAVALYEAEGWTRVTDLHPTYDDVVLDLWLYLSPTPT